MVRRLAPQGLEIGKSYCYYLKKPKMSPNRLGLERLEKLAYANNLDVSNKGKNPKLWVSSYFHVYTDDGLFKG